MSKKNNLLLISMVIPYYNTNLQLFRDTTKSLLAQSYINWEAVIVNDGSSNDFKVMLESQVYSPCKN